MRILRLFSTGLAVLAALMTGFARPPGGRNEPRLSIDGDVRKRRSYTNAELQQAFATEVRDVSFTLKGVKGRAHAIPLASLTHAAEEKVDPKRKNARLAYALVASAEDGYAVAFSAGELSPDIGNREVWVALDWDDKPLDAEDLPARLIVPGDVKPSRWVHGLRTLRVVDLMPKRRGR